VDTCLTNCKNHKFTHPHCVSDNKINLTHQPQTPTHWCKPITYTRFVVVEELKFFIVISETRGAAPTYVIQVTSFV
jgi:hypothetical protein